MAHFMMSNVTHEAHIHNHIKNLLNDFLGEHGDSNREDIVVYVSSRLWDVVEHDLAIAKVITTNGKNEKLFMGFAISPLRKLDEGQVMVTDKWYSNKHKSYDHVKRYDIIDRPNPRQISLIKNRILLKITAN